MYIQELLHALLRRPYVEVVEACLPERPALGFVCKQIALARVARFALGQQRASRALLQHLHHGRGSSNFGLGQEKVDVFRHDDVADDHEAVALARLFQKREEAVAAARGAQKRQSPVAGAGDKVQVMSAVGAMQSAGPDRPHGTGSIVPALAKNARACPERSRRDGEPTVPEREARTWKAGPPAQGVHDRRHHALLRLLANSR